MDDIPLRDTVPLEAIQLDSDLTYEEKPVKILEFSSKVICKPMKEKMYCSVFRKPSLQSGGFLQFTPTYTE